MTEPLADGVYLNLKAERWLPVPGYEGFYEVSDQGRIRSLRVNGRWGPRPRSTPRLRRDRPSAEGYRVIALMKDGKRFEERVHLLVLRAFAGPCPDGHEGAHRGDDKSDNTLAGLKWATHLENIEDRERNGGTARGERQGLAKLTAEAVRNIRASTETCAALAIRYGVNPTAVGFARRGVTWRHVAP